MNKVILMGRLTRDPDIRYGQGEGASGFARFTLAVDRRFKRQGEEQTADFLPCVVFSPRQVEFAEKYLKKGIKIALTGRIQTGSYTNREGQKVYTTDIVVEDMEFAESKSVSEGHMNAAGSEDYGARRPDPSNAMAVDSGFMNVPGGVTENDIPFN